jgi:hypothetical protein
VKARARLFPRVPLVAALILASRESAAEGPDAPTASTSSETEVTAPETSAAPEPKEPQSEPELPENARVDRLEVEGVEDTKPKTIEELLPRVLPTVLSRAELAEFERRVRCLALFDHVTVRVDADVLKVTVTEKGTLIPIFYFAGGKTVADSIASIGALHFNAFGEGTQLGAQAAYENRSFNVRLNLAQHAFRARAFSYSLTPYILGSRFLFPRARDAWTQTRYGASARIRFPFAYGMPFRFAVGPEAYYERTTEVSSRRPPPDGIFAGGRVQLTIDGYTFDDLVPHGYAIEVGAAAGAFLPNDELRGRVEVNPRVAVPLWRDAVVMFNGYTGYLAVKNPNASHGIDSGEIRGLRGVVYHADALGYLTTEIRQSYRFTSRWAVQLVPLADVGTFRTVSPAGKAEQFRSALSFGLGFRLVPTLISVAVLRIDAVRMVMPDEGYVVLASFDQFF